MTLNIGDASKRYNLTVSQPDNINESNINTEFFYPNPAKDYIYINNENIKNVKIYNINGQCVIDINTTNNLNKINLDNLETGCYILKAELNNSNTISKRISVMK